jgi:DNA (cytosine-5)-methyltransferase 1
MGYNRAGFDVVGVDINPQPRYPFAFVQGDALEYLSEHGAEFDAIHASPPCQLYSTMTKGRWKDREHPDLIKPVRDLLIASGKPYVIENVEGAREKLINPIMLCGTMFGLQTKHGSQLRRHRYFECSKFFILTTTCQHNSGSVIGVYGGGQNPARKRPNTIGVWGHAGGSSNRDGLIQFGTQDRRDAMGIDWMSGDELSEAIPPAYTEFIGHYLLQSEAVQQSFAADRRSCRS